MTGEMTSASLKAETIATTRKSGIEERVQSRFELSPAPVSDLDAGQGERIRPGRHRAAPDRARHVYSHVAQYSDRRLVERSSERVGEGPDGRAGRAGECPDVPRDLRPLQV